MPPSTLRTQRDELRQEVAYLLGYGRDSSAWSTGQIADIDQSVLRGLRRFYTDHRWTFMRPVVTFDTVAAKSDYSLPDMFAYLAGPVVLLGDTVAGHEIVHVSEHEYGKLIAGAGADRTGRPTHCTIGSVEAAQTTIQAAIIRFWPVPDAVYTVRSTMELTPNALTSVITDPPGGDQHAGAILAACEAEAKLLRDGEAGVHMQAYQDRLQASIALDNRNRPDYLGVMSPQDADREPFYRQRIPNVTYNGVAAT